MTQPAPDLAMERHVAVIALSHQVAGLLAGCFGLLGLMAREFIPGFAALGLAGGALFALGRQLEGRSPIAQAVAGALQIPIAFVGIAGIPSRLCEFYGPGIHAEAISASCLILTLVAVCGAFTWALFSARADRLFEPFHPVPDWRNLSIHRTPFFWMSTALFSQILFAVISQALP